MKCPTCRTWTFALESRMRRDNTRYRRYECANGHRFSTEERVTQEKGAKPRTD